MGRHPEDDVEAGVSASGDDWGPTVHVPIAKLLLDDSPRLEGEDEEHCRRLAAVEAPLPPIIVHRPTGRVIDGRHRVAVALLRGKTTIEARYFDGSVEQAFVQAVLANVTHGLPLTLRDREAAARRILCDFSTWSDRAIAQITGLASGTVGAIRRSLAGAGEAAMRVGLDGRVRPVDSNVGRRIASGLIRSRPNASLREVARTAGISPATARDVRARMERGEDPFVTRRRPRPSIMGATDATHSGPHGADWKAARSTEPVDLDAIMKGLRSDPALRFSDSGRTLLRWLNYRVGEPGEWEDMSTLIPPHSAFAVVRLARLCADEWAAFASHLERQAPRSV
jgi:hypothetical protein